MGLSQYPKVLTLLLVATVVGTWPGNRARAQVLTDPLVPAPVPATPPRETELINWVGIPTGEDIALMAINFQPPLLPGKTATEMSAIYTAINSGDVPKDNPLAKLMWAVQRSDQLAIKQAVGAVAREESKDAEAQFLGGLWAESKRGDSAAAIAWFLRARDLVESDPDKSFIDRYILGSALLADPGDDTAVAAGVAAALRLADSFWNASGGTARALGEMLTDFGELDAAAEVVANAKELKTPAEPRRGRRSSTNYQEVVNAFAAGDRELGLSTALTGVKQAIASFAQVGSLNNMNYNHRQMVQFVAAYGLSDAVLGKLKPGENATAEELANYAIAAEMLNKLDIALPEYRQILEKDPNQHAVRWRLIVNSVGEPTAQELLKEFPSASLQQYGSSLSNLLQSEQDFFRRLELVGLIRSFLDNAEPDLKGGLSWAANVLNPLVDDFYSDDIRVVGIHQISGSYSYDNDAQEQRSDAAAKKRAELHKQICESMLRHPTLASAAFTSISGFAGMPEWRSEAEFSELAREILASEHSPDQAFYYSHSSSSSYVLRLTPAQFLFRKAVDDDNLAVIDREVIPLVEKSGKVAMAGSMRAFSKLYNCTPEDFLGVATSIVEAGIDGVNSDSLINYIQSTAQHRDVDADLGPLVLSNIRKSRDNSSNVPYSARNYVSSVFSSRGADAAREFIDGVAEIYIGPREGRPEFVKKHYKSGYRRGDPSGYTYAFKEFLERLSSPMGVVVLAMENFVESGYAPVADNDMANRFENSVRSYRFDDSYTATYAMLDESPWLKSAEEFRVWPQRYLSEGSCYYHLIKQMKKSSSSVRKRMLSHVQAKKPETFGKNLTLACFESDPQRGVARVFSSHLKKLEKLPVERQKELAAWYQKLASDYGNARRRSADVEKVGKWIARLNAPPRKVEKQSGTGKSVVAKGETPPPVEAPPISLMIQTFLDAKTPGEASSSTLLHEHVLPILVSAAHDPILAARVFAHYRRLALMPQNVTRGRSSGEDSYDSQLLANFVQQIDPSRSAEGRSFAPLVAIFRSEAGREVVPGSGLTSVLRSIYSARRSDVSAGVGAVLETAATPERDAVAALLLALSAPARNGGQSVYGMRLNSLATVAVTNGWTLTAKVLGGDDPEAITNLIKLASAPIGLRLMATEAVVDDESLELIETGAELALTAFEQGAVLPQDTLFGLLGIYLELGDQQGNDEWRTTTRRLLHGAVQSLAPGSISAEQFVFLLNSAGKVGYSTRRIQMRFGQNFAQQPWFVAMLVKHRQFAAARRQLRSHLGQMRLPQVPAPAGRAPVMPSGTLVSRSTSSLPDGTRRITEGYDNGQEITFIEDQFGNRTIEGSAGSGPSGPVTFDAKLAAAIPDFVETISDPGLATLAELILLATPDPQNKQTPLKSGRVVGTAKKTPQMEKGDGVRKRVIAASARIAAKKVDNPFMEERILSILAPIALESPALRERIAAYSRNVDVVALAMFEDEAIKQPRQRIFKAYLDAALVHRPDDFGTIMESLLKSKMSRDYRVVQALRFYGSGFPDVLFQSADGFDRERAARYSSVFRRLLEVGGSNSEWRKRFDCLNGAIICHVMADKSAEFTEWFSTLDESLQSMFRSRVQLQRLLQLVSKPLSTSGMPEDERVAILGSLMEAKLFPVEGSENVGGSSTQALQGGGDELFESLVDEGVLPKSALIEYGPRWAEMNPREGAAWAEIAELQSKAGKTQEALESWVMAVATVPFDSQQRYTKYHLEAAKLLLKMGRLEPALTWFEFFNRGRLHDELELEFDTLFRDTRYKVMMGQGRTDELLMDALASLENDHSDTSAWQQVGSIFDALGRRKLAEGNADEAVPMLEFALLILKKTSAENPALGSAQVNEAFEALMEGRTALGELGDSVRFIPKNSEWRYFYSVAAARGWEQPGFDDSDWQKGVGQFGYGDDDEATLLDWGDDPDDKPITAYFRKVFTVESLADVKTLAIDLLRDDGALVYLNGEEIRRDNLPKGKLKFSTEAPSSPKKSEENDYRRTTRTPGPLKQGRNVIAVEVHQNDPDSSDLSFDLQLMSNTLDMEETVAAIDLGVLKQDIGTSTPRAEFENWMWEELDLARQPKRSTKQPEDILETGRRLLLNGIEVPRLLEQPRPRRRVILQPPTPN